MGSVICPCFLHGWFGIPFAEVAGEDIGSMEDDGGDIDELESRHCGS